MLYEFLKIIVLVFGPIAVYSAIRAALEVPELVTALPAVVQRAIEVVGVLFVVGGWLLTQAAPLNGGMVLIGLILLFTPLTAHKLSQLNPDVSGA